MAPGHLAMPPLGMHDARDLFRPARARYPGRIRRRSIRAGLRLSIDAQRAAHAAIHELAHQVAGGRWLLTGGGGYDLLQVVPRTWAHLLAEAAGHPIDPGARIPAAWREHASRRTGRPAPELMTEGAQARYASFESGYDPADPLDQAILATRTAVFPEHGIMPLP